MKRLGRKGHPTYRVVVQDSRQSPSSGKYVALLGSYDPHTKKSTLIKDKAEFYLKHGAQPSDRVISLLKTEKITLPQWVQQPITKEKSLKNPDKLRKNRPAEAVADAKPEPSEQPEEASPKPEENDKVAENPEPSEQPETVASEEKAKDEEAPSENEEQPKTKDENDQDEQKAEPQDDKKPEEVSEESSDTEDKS
jgi:small subunit ribosomal protein S16